MLTELLIEASAMSDTGSSSENLSIQTESDMPSPRILIYLLRRDLRLADNPIFHEISKVSRHSDRRFTHVLPVYVFPAQQVEVSGFLSTPGSKSPFPEARSEVGNFWRCGPRRATFLAESVWDLKKDLENRGSGLVVRVGMLGQVLKRLLDDYRDGGDVGEVSAVWLTAEEGAEEKREESDVRRAAQSAGIDFRLWRDEKYFIDDRDVPFEHPTDLPDVFTSYRKSVEPLRDAPRSPLPSPTTLPPLPSTIPQQPQPFHIPDSYDSILSALLSPLESRPILRNAPDYPEGTKSAHPFHGGSDTGHRRVQSLIGSGSMSKYKETRNGLLGLDFSTKLSAWLALGCITARQVHHQLLDFEEGRNDQWKGVPGYGKGENSGTAAVRFELLWRDYMRLCTKKFGPRLFRLEGFRADDSYPWKTPGKQHPEAAEMLERFLNGTTGTGLIDASQRELYHTGYTSNRARQNVASYLAKHLGMNWKLGAEWYESMLVDYDVSSNWGNWQYVAGVGNDPRGEARVFNPIKQACDYDPNGDYVKAWIPELRGVEDPQVIFQAWKLEEGKRAQYGLDGLEWVERPLKKIDFKVGSGKRGGGGGGRYGGSSRGGGRARDKASGGGEAGRGRGGGSFGARGGHRRDGQASGSQRGRGNAGREGRQGMMDKAAAFQGLTIVNGASGHH